MTQSHHYLFYLFLYTSVIFLNDSGFANIATLKKNLAFTKVKKITLSINYKASSVKHQALKIELNRTLAQNLPIHPRPFSNS